VPDVIEIKELPAKRARLQEVMRCHGLKAAVACSYQSVSYLAGTYIFTQIVVPDRMTFCLCLDDGSTVLILCSLETRMVRTQTDITDLVEYTEFVDDPTAVLAKVLRARGISADRVGVESRRLPNRSADMLRAAIPGIDLVAIDEDIEQIQGIKSEADSEMLRNAGCATLDAVLGGIARIQPGNTELELSAAIGSRMYTNGGMPTFTFFSTGERALGSHMEPTHRPLEEGDLWRIDLGGRFNELINSDMARTGVVGEPTAQQEDILQELLAIQAVGFAALEPGRLASEVYDAVSAEFARRNMDFQMPHVGHGIGVGIHEFPILQPHNHELLQPGMVVTIEPMFKAPDRGECYHVEDIALVTEDGFELLTAPQQSLLQIGSGSSTLAFEPAPLAAPARHGVPVTAAHTHCACA
jgi:Xaa-Pro aminopeptidase